MKLINKKEMNRWAYFQCLDGNDTEEIRSLITHPYYSYLYCRYIEDRDDMWRKITDPYWAKLYCEYVKERSEIRKIYKR